MAIKFDFTADNRNFIRTAKQTENAVHDITSATDGAAESFKNMITQAAGLAGVSFGLAGIKEFTSKVFEVRSYFQDINSSMVAFLGNQEKADRFTQQLKDYAWYNMFEFSELAQASQQMIAYGSNVEDVIPTIDRLSNIAVATKANLLDLVSMYNKAKSVGSVDSSATASWATHGLVIKNVLKDMGEEADTSSYTFDQLKRVIEHATDQGGLFYGQQEKMMDNLSSSLGQLQDDMDSMFNEIGESLQQPMKDAIEFASGLVDNYKELASTVGEVVAAYGVYRAALMATKSIDKTAGTIVYQAEIEAMQEALAVKKDVQHEDLAEAVTKGQLSQASADRIVSLREEIAAEEEEYAATVRAKVARGALTEEQGKEILNLRQSLVQKQDIANVEEEMAKSALERAKASLKMAQEEKASASEEVEWYNTMLERTTEFESAKQHEIYTEKLQDAIAKEHVATNKVEAATTAVVTAEEKLNTASRNVNAAAIVRQEVAQVASIKAMGLAKAASIQLRNIIASLNATMDANPIGLIVAAVTALGYAVYKLATYETDAAKSVRELNEAHTSFVADTQKEQREIDRLFGTLKKAKEGTDQYNDTKKTIMSKYGQYLQGLNEEISTLKDVEAAYRAVSAAAKDAAKNRAIDKQIANANDKWEADYSKGYERLKKGLEDYFGEGNEKKAAEYLELFRQQIEETGNVDYEGLLNTNWSLVPNAIKLGVNEMVAANNQLEKTTSDINAKFGTRTDQFNDWTDGKIDATIKSLEKLNVSVAEGKKGILKFEDGTQEEFYSTNAIDVYIKKLQEAKKYHADLNKEEEEVRNFKYWSDQKKAAEDSIHSIEDVYVKSLNAMNNADIQAIIDGKKMMEGNGKKWIDAATKYRDAKAIIDKAKAALKPYNESIKEDDRQSKKDAKNAQELIELQDKTKRERIRLAEETRIELAKLNNSIEEDNRKQLEQGIELEYEEAMEKIRQKREDLEEENVRAAKEIWSKQVGRKETDIFVAKESDKELTPEQEAYLNELDAFYKKKKAYQKSQIFKSDERDYNTYLEEYGTYEQKKTAIKAKYDEIRKNASEGVKLKADADENAELSQLESLYEKFDTSLESIFDRIEYKTRSAVNNAIAGYEKLITYLSTDKTIEDGNYAELLELGFSDEYLSQINSGKISVKELIDVLQRLKSTDDSLVGTFTRFKEGFNKIFSNGEEGETPQEKTERINEGLLKLGESLNDAGQRASVASGMMQDFFAKLGNDSASEAFGNIKTVLDTTMSMANAGSAFGKIGVAVGAAMGFASSLVTILRQSHDDALSDSISSIDKKIKMLTRSYENLESAVERTYSKDRAQNIESEIRNIQRQNDLINQQIYLEQKKKDVDQKAIDSYRDTIYENEKRIRDLREQAKDAIFGQDIKSAVERFADAYADAWSQNTNRTKTAKEQVREMMQNMVKESIKAAVEASGAMERIRAKLATMFADGIFTEAEQEAIYRDAAAFQEELDRRFGWSDELLDNNNDFTQKATSGGFTTMSQESADELNGRFSAAQMSIDQQTQTILMLHQVNQSMLDVQRDIYTAIGEIKNLTMSMSGDQQDIVLYTKRMSELGTTLKDMNQKLGRL